MDSLNVGNLSVKPGEKKTGLLKIGKRASSDVLAPLVVIRGLKGGPTLSIIAGEHGCEYCGIEAAIRIARDIKPADISGTLILITVANIPAFEEHTLFVCPVDGVNPYTLYPGTLNASFSYAMAYHIFHEVVLKSNYAVHLHCGDANEALVPFTYYAVTGNSEIDKKSEDMAKSFPVDYVYPMIAEQTSRESGAEGTSYSTGVSGTLYYEASIRGIPALMVEAGRDGKIEEAIVKIHYDGILNVMRYLKMIEGEPSINKQVKHLKNAVLVYPKKGGLFRATVEIGDMLDKGQIIGEIRDLYGETIETITSPIDGILICKVNHAAVDPYPTSWQPYIYYITEVE